MCGLWVYCRPSTHSCLVATLRPRKDQVGGVGCPLEDAHGKRPIPALEVGLGSLAGKLWSPGHCGRGLEGMCNLWAGT